MPLQALAPEHIQEITSFLSNCSLASLSHTCHFLHPHANTALWSTLHFNITIQSTPWFDDYLSVDRPFFPRWKQDPPIGPHGASNFWKAMSLDHIRDETWA